MAKEKKNLPFFDFQELLDAIEAEVIGGGKGDINNVPWEAIDIDTPNVPGGGPVFDGILDCATDEAPSNIKPFPDAAEPPAKVIDLSEVADDLPELGDDPRRLAALDFDEWYNTQLRYIARDYKQGDFADPDYAGTLRYYMSRKLLELENQHGVPMADIRDEWKNLIRNKTPVFAPVPKGWPIKPKTYTPTAYIELLKVYLENPEFKPLWNSMNSAEKKAYAMHLHELISEKQKIIRQELINVSKEIIQYRQEVAHPIYWKENPKKYKKYKEFIRARISWKNSKKVYTEKQLRNGRKVMCGRGKGGSLIFFPVIFGIHIMTSDTIGQAAEYTAEDIMLDLMDPLYLEAITGDLDSDSEINWDMVGDDEYLQKLQNVFDGYTEGDLDYDTFKTVVVDLHSDAIENEIRSQISPITQEEADALHNRTSIWVENKMTEKEFPIDTKELQNYINRQRVVEGAAWDSINSTKNTQTPNPVDSCSSFDYTGFLNPPMDDSVVVISCADEVTPTPTPMTPTPTPTATAGMSTPTPSMDVGPTPTSTASTPTPSYGG
jgi:hypothetical protein